MAAALARIPLDQWAGWYALEAGQAPSIGADNRPDPSPAHVGLWLDRCLVESDGAKDKEHPGRHALYAAACEALDPAAGSPALANYRTLFAGWERLARARHPGVIARVLKVRARSRLLLHPSAGASVTDGGILLHHTYGVPYLPGTALKGVCRAYAQRLETEGKRDIPSPRGDSLPDGWVAQLFGHVPAAGEEGGEAGLFDFWDALWVPPESNQVRTESPLALDVVNPHHREYYTKGANGDREPPRESDAPIPTHRLTVRPGTSFLLRVEAIDNPALSPWLDWVVDILLLPALDWEGIGTRTTSGYGRLVEVGPAGGPGKGRAGGGEGGRDIVQVTRTRNDGAIHAILPDRKVASLRGPRAREIYLGLSETVRGRIDRGKPVRLYVTWTKAGNLFSIEDIQENP